MCSIMLASCPICAQEKGDFIWLFGDTPNDSVSMFGGTKIDFNFSPPAMSFFNLPFSFNATAMLSDKNGELLLYTNGCAVANREHKIMPNGTEINVGFLYNSWCKMSDLGYPRQQGITALPYPDSNHIYAIVHTKDSEAPGSDNNELLYSLVDMSADSGRGAVTLKNQLIYTHDQFASNMTAVRHGNGRDWWIIEPKRESNRYFKFLLTPKGFSGPLIQDFGLKWTIYRGGNQACFSPDGSKYIRMAAYQTGCQIADFDRCTGELSNPVNLSFPADTFLSAGCAVSSNNRFLYLSARDKMWQFDLQAPDISASRVLLGEYDGYQSPLSAAFFQCMLAPDGKIYMTSPNGVTVLHVIHNPNEKGLACNFEQHGIQMFTKHSFSVPNFPHLRLLDLPGSPCDTLGINGTSVPMAVPQPGHLRLLPNPAVAGESVRMEAGDLFESGDRLALYSATGQYMKEQNLPSGQSHTEVDVGVLPPGVYWVVLRRARGAVQRGQLVVLR